MEIEFWQQRWQDNQIGFHLPEVNPYLVEYWSLLEVPDKSVVFVPLCGKSIDLAWLASQNYSVLGIECSEKAVQEFFKEQKLSVQLADFRDFKVHHNGNINILQGDYFKLDTETLADVKAVYDRASLVALPEKMRQPYVDLLVKQLPESVSILLVTLQYEQQLMTGPPFSLPDDEVQRLYSDYFNIELLHERNILEEQQRFKERGLNYLIERVYKISR